MGMDAATKKLLFRRTTEFRKGWRPKRRGRDDGAPVCLRQGSKTNPPPVAECVLCGAGKPADTACLCRGCRTDIDRLWEVVK